MENLERQHRGTLNLHYSAMRIMSHIKPLNASSKAARPIVLADSGFFPQLLQYMQFMVDADWYASDAFTPQSGGGMGMLGVSQKSSADSDPSTPLLIQQERIEYIDSVRKGIKEEDFVRIQSAMFDRALDAGRKVYVVLKQYEPEAFRKKFVGSAFEMVEIEQWVEPCAARSEDAYAHTRLMLNPWRDDQITPWHPMRRVMFEIRRPSATQPASQSSIEPSAQPEVDPQALPPNAPPALPATSTQPTTLPTER